MGEAREITVQIDRRQMGRTLAMGLFAAGNGLMTGVLASVLVIVAVPAASDPELAAAIPVFIAIAAIVGVIAVLAVVWPGARRRPWFWAAGALPGLFVLARKIPEVAYDIGRPADTEFFLLSIFALTGGLAIILGGVTAFVEARRGRPVWTRTGRAGWLSMAVTGLLVGAAITSLLAGSASAGGAGVAAEPTVSRVLTVENTAFDETSLQMNDGEVLGLFIVNKDPLPHSFDIDSLDIHVQLPPNSTTAVAIAPSGPGEIEFYCAVPGHVAAGMVGSLVVE